MTAAAAVGVGADVAEVQARLLPDAASLKADVE